MRTVDQLSMLEVLTIWTNVADGFNHHGTFLRKFGEAMCAADSVNLMQLRKVSDYMIEAYELNTPEYLKQHDL